MSKKLMRICTESGLVSLAGLILATLAMTSCGDVVRTGRGPVVLVMNSLTGGTAATPYLLSDVVKEPACVPATTPPTICPTVVNDVGAASLTVVMKDSTLTPTTNNQVTISRYHVMFRRADGRNTPGVDVPWAFDGAVTVTIEAGNSASAGFELVRHTAKTESPLFELRRNPNVISTTADVTFYGQDLVGNDISVTGHMLVDFANFGDTP